MSGEERYPPFEQLGSGRTEGSGNCEQKPNLYHWFKDLKTIVCTD